MYIIEKEARAHNLVIRLEKEYSIKQLNEGVYKSDLINKLCFRKLDFRNLREESNLKIENEICTFSKKIIEGVEYLKNKKRLDNDIEKLKKEYINEIEHLPYYYTSEKITEDLLELANKIHWNIIPEYREYDIVSIGVYPNYDTKEYYCHCHTLEDLFNQLIGKGKNTTSIMGDKNLYKKIMMNIDSNSYFAKKSFNIARTVDGWDIMPESKVIKKGNKEGDVLIKYLKDWSISYPHLLNKYMKTLWNKADSQEMSIEKLRYYLKQIENWINKCEINTPRILG